MELDDNINNLRSLKKEYDHRAVSALIGAGFSKNVSSLYMDWDELLTDIIDDLYELEIQQYIQHCRQWNRNSQLKDVDEQKLKKGFVNNILKSYGHLGIVSNYIAQKGYREVIENYIEERTPYAKKHTDGTISLYIKGTKKINVNVSDFSAHKQLLLCDKFRNIYTTNYDNLLEFTAEHLSKKTTEIPCVTTSWGLSDGFQKRSIIKIHGTLSTEDDSEFGFDDDKHIRYIIAQEDYDTYIEKHEAFSHLMRISMLQGKFCLLGFSGNDPNYMGWVKWISDILYKAKTRAPKIYLVTFKNEQSPDKKLYYKNHYIREINLMDNDVLSYLGYEQSEIAKLLTSVPFSYKEVIGRFLKFLSCTTDSFKEEESSNVVDICIKQQNINTLLSEIETKESFEPEYTTSYDYKELWNEAVDKLHKKEELFQVQERIIKAKDYNRFCKSVYSQAFFIDTIINRKDNLSEPEANLFALAVQECGQLPNYYSLYLKDKPILNEIPRWKQLQEREETLKGNNDSLPENSDFNIYENIQRKLFHLNFEEAKKSLDTWHASGHWLNPKIMRLAGYETTNELHPSLTDYITKVKDPQEKMYACVLANYISNKYPHPYNLDIFLKKNIHGQGDIISYLSNQLRDKEDDPKVRGWIGTTHYFDSRYRKYEKSLRFLQFIFDSGLYLSYGITNFVDIREWYKVCKNLYRYFPFPCFFYSIQYNNQKALERIGQDFAFSPELQEENEALLSDAIKAYGSKFTPKLFLSGILNITGPLYLCIDESIWFASFKTNIFDKMIARISEYTHSEEIVRNTEYAVSNLKHKEHILIILESLLSHFKKNPILVNRFVRNIINLHCLEERLDNTCEKLLEELINEFPQVDVSEIVYFFNENKCLTFTLLNQFTEKLRQTRPEDIPTETSSLFYICALAIKDNEIIQTAKRKLLEKDIWHCGVLEEGKKWTYPQYVRLHIFNDIIKWNEEEFDIVANNLEMNINTYKSYSEMLHQESLMRNMQITYLSDVLLFIESLDAKQQNRLKHIRETTKDLLHNRVSYNSFIEAMLSEQSADVSNGIDNIVQGIRTSGLKPYHNEINFIVDRAIIGNEIAMAKNLSVIQWLIEKHEDEFMKMNIDSKLSILLSVYKTNWQNMDEFRPDLSFDVLYTIAKYLSRNGDTNEDIQYWLTDTFVKKFLSN